MQISMPSWTTKPSSVLATKSTAVVAEGGAASRPAAPKIASLGIMLKRTVWRNGPQAVAMVAAWKSMGRRSSTTMAPLRTLRSSSQTTRMVNSTVITVWAMTM